MEISVVGRDITISDRLREHVEEKVTKFEQLGKQDSEVHVKFTKEGHTGHQTIRVEITVSGSGLLLRAESSGTDKFAVFDETYGKLLERLRRARDRRKTPKHGAKRPLSVAEATGVAPVIASDAIPAGEDQTVEEAAFDEGTPLDAEVYSPIEVRRKKFKAVKLTPEEAIDQMELVGHDFFIFIDQETGSPSAVYRRKGWSYGVITLEQ